MAKNYYIILGLSQDASEEDIRCAYRRLAKEYHPDHYGEDHHPFLQIQEAYSILSDPGRRRRYDESLHSKQRPSPPPIRDITPKMRRSKHVEPLHPHRDAPQEVYLSKSHNRRLPSSDRIFERLMNAFRDIDTAQHRRPVIDIPLSPGEASTGGRARMYVPASIACTACMRSGSAGFWKCRRCGGAGCIEGEYPVTIAYPGGITDGHTAMISLDNQGMYPVYLTVRFRIITD
ncbi:MAG: DnaJ domain-containing protein [Chitinivibrionales bacterium]|nr:DnaJ domain-containing protein [Chitinivibrionales bacterium]